MPVIATNTAANTALIALNKNSRVMSTTLSKLSSGSRIVRASDDAAGLAVSTSLQADITTLKQASINAVQAQSILQAADGALARTQDIFVRMKALATQAISGSLSNTQRGFLDNEYQQLSAEVVGIESGTTFNGIYLLDNSFHYEFQVGIDATASDIIDVDLTSVWTGGLPGLSDNVATAAGAVSASNNIDTALNSLSQFRATVGSYSSVFGQRGDVINTTLENLLSARSAIVDTDIAGEQTTLVSEQVLTESSIAALTQANKMKSDLLTLVR